MQLTLHIRIETAGSTQGARRGHEEAGRHRKEGEMTPWPLIFPASVQCQLDSPGSPVGPPSPLTRAMGLGTSVFQT